MTKKIVLVNDNGELVETVLSTANNYFSATCNIYEAVSPEEVKEAQKLVDDYMDNDEADREDYENACMLLEEVEEIKGSLWRCYAMGCNHEAILEVAPQLEFFVKMHLSDLDGKPMHAYENGKYHLKHSGKEACAKYLRTTPDKFSDILGMPGFDEVYCTLLPQWKEEAVNALEQLGKW